MKVLRLAGNTSVLASKILWIQKKTCRYVPRCSETLFFPTWEYWMEKIIKKKFCYKNPQLKMTVNVSSELNQQ